MKTFNFKKTVTTGLLLGFIATVLLGALDWINVIDLGPRVHNAEANLINSIYQHVNGLDANVTEKLDSDQRKADLKAEQEKLDEEYQAKMEALKKKYEQDKLSLSVEYNR